MGEHRPLMPDEELTPKQERYLRGHSKTVLIRCLYPECTKALEWVTESQCAVRLAAHPPEFEVVRRLSR